MLWLRRRGACMYCNEVHHHGISFIRYTSSSLLLPLLLFLFSSSLNMSHSSLFYSLLTLGIPCVYFFIVVSWMCMNFLLMYMNFRVFLPFRSLHRTFFFLFISLFLYRGFYRFLSLSFCLVHFINSIIMSCVLFCICMPVFILGHNFLLLFISTWFLIVTRVPSSFFFVSFFFCCYLLTKRKWGTPLGCYWVRIVLQLVLDARKMTSHIYTLEHIWAQTHSELWLCLCLFLGRKKRSQIRAWIDWKTEERKQLNDIQ